MGSTWRRDHALIMSAGLMIEQQNGPNVAGLRSYSCVTRQITGSSRLRPPHHEPGFVNRRSWGGGTALRPADAVLRAVVKNRPLSAMSPSGFGRLMKGRVIF